jgi:Zn-dependent peptidase ImmA (M78 family)
VKKLAALALFLWVGSAGWAAEPPTREQIDALMKELSAITGLAQKREVPVSTMTREQWKAWLEREIAEKVKPEEIRAEELVMKKLGLAPADFDLKKTTIDLLTEQAAAFYDHKQKRMVFVEGASGEFDQMVLAHELSHALADQHFKLGRFLDSDATTDDGSLARLAAVEGQAMYLMLEVSLRRNGMTLAEHKGALDILANATSTMAEGMFPVFDKSPLYLRESLLFPYKEGVIFQQAVVEKQGQDGFSEILRRPPASTQEVMHPEKYLAGVEPVTVAVPALAQPGQYKKLIEGTLGEIDFRVLIQQYGNLDEARRIAQAWRGGHFSLDERKKDGRLVLRVASLWDSPEAAQEFSAAYRKILAAKWKRITPGIDKESLFAGEGDDGRFLVRTEGSRVESIEGMELDGDAKRPAL